MEKLEELKRLESRVTKEIARLQMLGQYGLQLELHKELQRIRESIEKHERRSA